MKTFPLLLLSVQLFAQNKFSTAEIARYQQQAKRVNISGGFRTFTANQMLMLFLACFMLSAKTISNDLR